jgi:outer membrane protein OmpA-like peptidoglycan-associated protein
MWGGGEPAAPPTAVCSAQPTEVFAGNPVTVSATGSNFNPKRTVKYTWNGTGLKVSGSTSSAQVETIGLQPGSYSVNANLSDGSKNGIASCSAKFTIKEPHPPVISCSANPSTVQPGGSSTINSDASSPDGRKLTYSYSASIGSISGSDSSATLNTGSAQPGPITVTCNAMDDRQLSASSTTTVTVEAPPPPPPPPSAPEASKLNQIDFKKNSPRVDNAAKAILDGVALRMQRDADARVVLVGESDSSERGAGLSAQRALNTKAYLVTEKGIDASRIEVRTGNAGTMQTDIWLVPAGATFNAEGTKMVDESKTRARTRK